MHSRGRARHRSLTRFAGVPHDGSSSIVIIDLAEPMITNEVHYRATKAHLDRFEEAAANIEARPGERTRLEALELAAIGAGRGTNRPRVDSAGTR